MNTNMKAIILAAGKCSRLYPITLETPKCLLEVGGKSIINRQIESIREAGIEDIVVVVGYKKDIIKNVLGNKVRYRDYSDFNECNNMHTLWSVRDELDRALICLFSDLIFETGILKKTMESVSDIDVVVDTSRVLEGTMRIKLSGGKLAGIGSHIPVSEGDGNFIGMAKFSKSGAAKLRNKITEMAPNHKSDYYTSAIDALIQDGEPVGYSDVAGKMWIEIDTQEDLNTAETIVS